MLGNPVLDEGMGQFGERNGVENLVDWAEEHKGMLSAGWGIRAELSEPPPPL